MTGLLVDLASGFAILAGALFMVTGGIGMLRLPDLFARLHAAGVADTGGAALMLLGMALQAGFTLVTVKLIMIGVFLVFTAPVASHAVGHAALLGGLSPHDSAARGGTRPKTSEGRARA